MRNDVLLDQAGAMLRGGRAGKAASLLAPVVGNEPDNAGAWRLLARARLQLGEPVAALEAARTALRLESGDLESLYLVSAAYSMNGRHDLAIAAATTACDEDPGNPRLTERLGRALLAAGRVSEAETTLRIAAEFAAYDADVQVAHGIALFASGRPQSARDAYARALRIEPGHVRANAEVRRLTQAEAVIVDAASLVQVTDAFAESLRVPLGGRRRPANRRGALAYVAGVIFSVCLVALLMLGLVATAGAAAVPQLLVLGLLAAVVGASLAALTTRRRRR